MTVMHIGLTDGSNLLTNYMGTSYMVAVLISVFADTFIGRYKTVIISSVIELVGLLILTLQAHSNKLKPPYCVFPFDPKCETVSGDGRTHLYVGLYLVAIGSAGIKAALPAHCADQFDEKHPTEKLQMSSFFNWLLLSLCAGGAISVTVFVWIQNYKGWDKGFGAATGVMGLALLVFIAGLPGYRISVVQGSTALLEILQVYVAAIRNRNMKLPENPDELYEISKSKAPLDTDFMAHRDKPFRFLDKAAIVQAPTDEAPSPWRQCRVTQVEHAKTVLAMVPIFCSAIIMSTCLAQLQTFSIQQGVTMDRTIGTFKMPPASLPIIPLIVLVFAVPIYERGFVPFARRITGHPNGIPHLQRVGVGLVLSIVSMAIAAVVEVRRKRVAARHGMLDANPMLGKQLPISCFWLAPQFTVFGVADMFTFIGLLEFFYSQAPPALKSMSSSFLWCPMSLGYFLSTIIVKAVNAATKGATASGGWLAGNNINRNHLDLFFWLLAVLSFLNFLNYLFWASWYEYKPQQSAHVPAEHKLGSEPALTLKRPSVPNGSKRPRAPPAVVASACVAHLPVPPTAHAVCHVEPTVPLVSCSMRANLTASRPTKPTGCMRVCDGITENHHQAAAAATRAWSDRMASSDEKPLPTPISAAAGGSGGNAPPGRPTTVDSMLLDKGAAMLQALRPVKHIKQHVCTFALYAHDPRRQVETHHFVSRLNQDVLQCAIYDADDKHARLIGVEYIVSRKIFDSLPAEEQRLWHSHAHEIKAGLWVSPHVPGMLEKAELEKMAGTFGKFWCTWQVDRGDRLPLGAPALMVSPQDDPAADVRPDLVRNRDDKYRYSTTELRAARADVAVPAEPRPGQADYWLRHRKGFAVDVLPHEMKCHAPFP
uniref:Uncharacterized protein n=1 Tax=Oryza meridionalis TaxID=40149 RepID=A0A0E0C7Q3_9ORYZ